MMNTRIFLALKEIFAYYGYHHNKLLTAELWPGMSWLSKKMVRHYYDGIWDEIPKDINILFIHIPKTAGTSISNSIYGKFINHRPAFFYWASEPDRFRDTVCFSVVRNPFDRFCSLYYHIVVPLQNTYQSVLGRRVFISGFGNPDEFAQELMNNSLLRNWYISNIIARPQKEWLMGGGEVLVKNLFLFEELAALERFLREIMGGRFSSFPHLNRNPSREMDSWEEELSGEAKHAINLLYGDDIELWNALRKQHKNRASLFA